MNFCTWNPLKRTILLLAVLALGAVVVVAVHDIALFELEGDATDAALVAGEDWDRVLGFSPFTSPSGSDEAHLFVNDGVSLSIYTTGGSKDDLDVSNWRHTDGQVPDKDEIVNAFAAAYVNPSTVGNNQAGDLILYFGADRLANNGDAQIGFWFFKKPVGLAPNGTFVDGSGNLATHSVGDILTISDFTQGGRISTIKIYEWVGTGGDTNGTLNLLFTGQDCHATGLSDDAACATVNDIPQPAPWPYTPKFGSSGTFPTGSLFEGGINISRLDRENNRPSPGCFTSFLGETRSSQSVDAQLKDFAMGAFDLCSARISIEEDATNEVRDDHTFTITVEKKGPPNYAFAPASGIEVTASLDGVGSFDGSNLCTTNASGQCTVTISSEVAGTSTVSASATVAVDGVSFELETDGEAGNSDAAVKTWVDAKISIGDSATNEVGAEHTFTVTLLENAGSGFGAAAGEHVDFSLTNHFGASCEVDEAASTCDDAGANTDSNGQCTIVFSSSTTGQCVGSASSTLTVGGLSLFRETDGSYDNSGEATKTYVDARISVTPLNATNPVNEAHTITAKVEIDAGGGSGFVNAPNNTLVTFSLLNNGAGATFVGNVNTCQTSGGTGQCSVQINSTQSGGVDIRASSTVTVGGVSLTRTTGSAGNSADAHKDYVAGRLTIRKITLGGVGQFSFSSAALGGFSLTTSTPSVAVSQSFNNLAPDDYSVTETVPANWKLTDIACDSGSFLIGSDGDFDQGDTGVTVSLEDGDDVTCTFTNQAFGRIIVDKVTDPAGDPQSFSFTAGGSPSTYNNFSLTDAADPNNQELKPGTYSVSETVPSGWDQTSATCDDGSPVDNISLSAGETVTCTFNNRKRGRIVVIKNAVPDDAQDFAFTAGGGLSPASFSLDDDADPGLSNTRTFDNLAPGSGYSLAETVPSGWDQTSATCSDSSPVNNISVSPGETVTCTFVNTKRGTIIVEKQTNPDGAPGSFTFTGTAAGSLSDNGQITVANLVPGTYSSTEADPTPNFDLVSIVCNDSNSSGNVGTRTATFNLDPGETVKCTFTNRQRGLARLIKTFLGSPPFGNLAFSFDLRQGATLTSLGTVLESGVANAANGGIINFSTKLVPGTTYQLCETAIMPGWMTTLATLGAFVPGGSLPDPDNSTLCLNFSVNPGETREFRIDNTPPPGGLAHTIGFWKNWTSCDGHGNQAPVLDQTLAAAGGGILIGDVFVDTCLEGIRILDKSQISSGKKMASDPAYNLAAQLLAARLNIVAQAGSCSAANTAMAQAQALLDAINFTGNGTYRGTMSAAQRSAALNLAAILDSYNNNLLCFSF